MSATRRDLSLRTRLLVLGLAGMLYVVIVTVQLSSVLRPAAAELRGRTKDLLADHDRIARGLRTLRDARRDVARYVPPVEVAGPRRALAEIRTEVRGLVDSGAVVRASIEQSGVPPEMRFLLADAIEQATTFAVDLVDAVRFVETGRPVDAIPVLRASGLRSDSAEHLLSSAQRIALQGLIVSEDRLQIRLDAISRWAIVWLVVGLLLFVLAAGIIRARVLRPVRALEAAVQRVASGDLAASVDDRRDDELGRLARHVNTMTARLRARAEEQVARHESITDRLGRLLDESANEIGVFEAGSLRALQLNRGARENLGLAPEEVAGMTLPRLLSSIEPTVLEAELDRLRRGERHRLLLRTRQTRRDGTSYPVEVTIQHSVDRDASVFITVAEDGGIRERARELDAALTAFALDENQRTGDIELVDALGAIATMAAEALRAQRVSVWRESSGLRACIGASDLRDAAELAGRSFPDAAHLALPVPVGGRTGTLVVAERSEAARGWMAEEETFLRAVCAMVARAIDAEERRLLEQALARAQRLDSIGQLAGGVAHDFNNILTAILGNLESVRTTLGAESAVDDELGEAEQAARRAADLTRQLLTFARHQRVDLHVVDVSATAQEAERMLRRLVGAAIRIETELHPGPLHVRIGAGQLEQLLVNLAVNARDAMPQGGVIRLASRPVSFDEAEGEAFGLRAGRFVELRVVDSGVGMPPEVVERVFDPFFTTKSPGAGTGLGLAVCYGIVRQADGSIHVTSAPGVGTTFRVLLPAVQEAPSPAPPAAAVGADGRGETVLVAEDERVIRDLVQRALLRRGYRVLTAADGQEALEVARSHDGPIDLLVSDVVMPRLGGPELARALRRGAPDLRVLLMSGYSADALREGQDVPGSDFVAKPFTPDELVRRVRALLDRPDALTPSTAR